MKAWIENGVVRDVCSGDPNERYHPDIAAFYDTDIPEGIVNGATQINGVWVNPAAPLPYVPDIPLAMLKQQKTAELAALRYEKEIAGITVNGAAIATDRTSQALVNGAYSYSLLNPAVHIDWKTASGAWAQIDAATISGIAGAVAAHVQACFSAERVHAEAIAALETAEEVAAYDASTGWPG